MFAHASHVLLVICCGTWLKAVAMDIEEIYRLLSNKVDAVETRVNTVNFEIKFLRNQIYSASEKIKTVELMMENIDITSLGASRMISDETNSPDRDAIDDEIAVVEDTDTNTDSKIIMLRNAVINEKRFLRDVETKLESLIKLISGDKTEMSGNFSSLNLRCAANEDLISQHIKNSNEQIQIAKVENTKLIKEVGLLQETTASLRAAVDDDINQSKAAIEAMQKTLDSRLDNFRDTMSIAITKEVMEHAGALPKGGRCEVGQNTVSDQDTDIMFKERFSSEPTVLNLSEDGKIAIAEVTEVSFRIRKLLPPLRRALVKPSIGRSWRRARRRPIPPVAPHVSFTVKWIACV